MYRYLSTLLILVVVPVLFSGGRANACDRCRYYELEYTVGQKTRRIVITNRKGRLKDFEVSRNELKDKGVYLKLHKNGTWNYAYGHLENGKVRNQDFDRFNTIDDILRLGKQVHTERSSSTKVVRKRPKVIKQTASRSSVKQTVKRSKPVSCTSVEAWNCANKYSSHFRGWLVGVGGASGPRHQLQMLCLAYNCSKAIFECAERQYRHLWLTSGFANRFHEALHVCSGDSKATLGGRFCRPFGNPGRKWPPAPRRWRRR